MDGRRRLGVRVEVAAMGRWASVFIGVAKKILEGFLAGKERLDMIPAFGK